MDRMDHKFQPGYPMPKFTWIISNKSNDGPPFDGFVPKEDETTGLFPESVLLKQKVVQEDGKLLPEFADDDEQELYEALNLMLESDLDAEQTQGVPWYNYRAL
ncbi:ribosomal protein S6, Translation elongation factor EF1B/ribosomal protein S6 [Artemisia annua]|uniref:Ribosomal protein S6, Translation elongation factor EF1B/ribosomal protein S6 n=1 Tax=Artemisia annua TaxID=35608 RepID=A0A2U1KBV0_ARTAN|nr:ribosomal protein S6, Translation elongation factor EF1B/ribosomal protein S6 [Artemisia annua]